MGSSFVRSPGTSMLAVLACAGLAGARAGVSGGGSGSAWLREAAELAPKFHAEFHRREEGHKLMHDLVDAKGRVEDVEERLMREDTMQYLDTERLVPGREPLHSTRERAARRRGRRLASSSPELCPTPSGTPASYGAMYLNQETGVNAIQLYNEDAGYGSSLFCQWTIDPNVDSDDNKIVVQQISLVFDSFDVPIGFDTLRVYQLKCIDEECSDRERVELLEGGYPASFEDQGVLPPLVFAQETAVNQGVQMLVRFTSKYSSGATGFVASYTVQSFDLLEASPILMPQGGGTLFTIKGTGFDTAASLYCTYSGKSNPLYGNTDALVVTGRPPDERRAPPSLHSHRLPHAALCT